MPLTPEAIRRAVAQVRDPYIFGLEPYFVLPDTPEHRRGLELMKSSDSRQDRALAAHFHLVPYIHPEGA